MTNDLKQELDAELSRLMREYRRRGLDPDEIGDSLYWHSELAVVMDNGRRVSLQAND